MNFETPRHRGTEEGPEKALLQKNYERSSELFLYFYNRALSRPSSVPRCLGVLKFITNLLNTAFQHPLFIGKFNFAILLSGSLIMYEDEKIMYEDEK
jgi:hypothetical protein